MINLNIGNPAPFGFDAPDEIVHDIIMNIRNAQGYSDSRGLFAARKAVMHYTQTQGIPNVEINDIFIGNGVSELILLTMQALLNTGEAHGLIIFSDEIYDRILYDGAVHHPMAKIVEETLCVTFGGLSKNYRAAGFRGGWMILSGAKHRAKSYLEGLLLLASLRLCANVPTQYAIQTALGGYQSIQDLVLPSGRLTAIPGITCVKPKGALYLFPKIDLTAFDFANDGEFVYDLLSDQKVLVVAGTGFNYIHEDHFRIVFLPTTDELNQAMDRMEHFLESRRVPAARTIEEVLS